MRRPGHDEWLKLVSEYETSGLQQKEFCAKHDVPLNTLQYWLYKRSKKSGSQSGLATKFLPIEVVPSTALSARREQPTSGVMVELPSGVRVHLSSDVPARYVAELLAGLR
jgi:hypothetical protein